MSTQESHGNVVFPCFIDFEASGLANESYPIEVAWSLPDGTVREFLIRREPNWDYWDEQAEALHGISREELATKGQSACEICRILEHDLKGNDVYADGGLCDVIWLKQLLAAGKCQTAIDLRTCVADFFFPAMSIANRENIQGKAWQAVGQRHRAGNDVRWFVEFLRMGRLAHFTDDVPNSVDASNVDQDDDFLYRLNKRGF